MTTTQRFNVTAIPNPLFVDINKLRDGGVDQNKGIRALLNAEENAGRHIVFKEGEAVVGISLYGVMDINLRSRSSNIHSSNSLLKFFRESSQVRPFSQAQVLFPQKALHEVEGYLPK